MKNIRAFAAFLLMFVFGQQVQASYLGLDNAKMLQSVAAVEIEVYTFDTKGRYVELDYQYELLSAPTSKQDLADQLYWIGGSYSKSNYSGRIYRDARLLDSYDQVVYESLNSFLPERVKRRGKWSYQTPKWGVGYLYFQSPEDSYDYDFSFDDPKVTKVKEWSVDVYFNWVEIDGIEQVSPDLRGFVDVLWLDPENGRSPAFETTVPSSGVIKLFGRSHSGFVPISVKITTYGDLSDYGAPTPIPYSDDMPITGTPGVTLVLEYLFDQRPVDRPVVITPIGTKG